MDKKGINMIDVTAKKVSERMAVAAARIKISADTMSLIKKGQIPKGDVLTVSQTAGIMAAKKTPDLLPLCHPLLVTSVVIEFKLPKAGCIYITATVKGKGRTGFEMEALAAVSIAALTVYDMCKMLDKNITIIDIRLLKKTGGKSGTYMAK
jgi:cyclic pyranopterin monophosphate synthase